MCCGSLSLSNIRPQYLPPVIVSIPMFEPSKRSIQNPNSLHPPTTDSIYGVASLITFDEPIIHHHHACLLHPNIDRGSAARVPCTANAQCNMRLPSTSVNCYSNSQSQPRFILPSAIPPTPAAHVNYTKCRWRKQCSCR